MSLKHSSITRESGFSLVEIMVGMAIGLLTTLVIMQVFSAFEGQKRSTTGSADAQTSGGLLAAVAAERAEDVVGRFHAAGFSSAAVIGRMQGMTPVVNVSA